MPLSLLFGVIEPVSAAMLANLVLRHRDQSMVTAVLRFWLALLAIGLIVHAAQQWALVFDYRPPRTWLWVPLILSVNGMIWTAWFADRAHRPLV